MAGLFDKQAEVYANARPVYPPALFDFITRHSPARSLAWDVATGSGQAAVALSERFDRVVATDASEEQLKFAAARPNIRYAATSARLTWEEARDVVGGEACVDLVTVAQALHWLDADTFHPLVRRILKPGGVLAAWTYDLLHVDADVDRVIAQLYKATQPYWAPQRAYVNERYRTIPFPYAPPEGLDTTGPFEFESRKELGLDGVMLYLRSWSAIQTALDAGVDFLAEFRPELQRAWGAAPTKTVTWPVFVCIGRV